MDHLDGYKGVAHFYDLFDTKPNIPFYLKIVNNLHPSSDTILDLGAGTGRISIPLVEAGYQVIAVEPSEDMLNIFRSKLETIDVDITLHKGNADNFQLDQQVDLVIMSGVFDHLLSKQERFSSLQQIEAILSKHGRLVFDSHLGLMRDRPKKLINEITVENKILQRYIEMKKTEDKLISILEYHVRDLERTLLSHHSVVSHTKSSTVDEIDKLLAKSGFEVISKYSDYKFSPFNDDDDDLLLIVASKKDS